MKNANYKWLYCHNEHKRKSMPVT